MFRRIQDTTNFTKMKKQADTIDWSSSNVLLEIVTSIKAPLSSIMAANNKVGKQLIGNSQEQNTSAITLQNSKKIVELIDEVLAKMEKPGRPIIFELYENNPQVKAMCSGKIDTNKISQTDKVWLLNLEKAVLEEPTLDQLSLFGLAFEVSVSERQLHRNIKKFLSLTPNKYVRILKLHKAKQLLEEYTYRTISEVSYAVGYNDVHYFSKLFHKQYCVMPKDLIPA